MAVKSARRWFISGRVQGVGFRYFVRLQAQGLGLAGWTRNLSDGRVEVYAMGNAGALDDLAAALHKGPQLSDVRGVEQLEATPERLSDFEVR